MKRETRFFTLLALGSTMAFSGIAQAQPQGMPPEAMAQMQAAQRGQGGAAPNTAGADAGVVTNQTTTESTTTVVPTTDVMTETTSYDTAPLENTGGEPLLFAIGGALLAGSALVMRRRLSNEVR